MVEASDYLIKNQMVHLDLTPHNVIVIGEFPEKIEI